MNARCGKFISIGSIEPQFYAAAPACQALPTPTSTRRWIARHWPALKEKLADVFKSKTRDGLVHDHGRHRHLLRADPDHGGSAEHPHNAAREIFVNAPRRAPARAGAALLAHASAIRDAGSTADIVGLTSDWQGVESKVVAVGPAGRSTDRTTKRWVTPSAATRYEHIYAASFTVEHAAADLVFLDRFEQRLEIAFAESHRRPCAG